jgi:hypothetical protein
LFFTEAVIVIKNTGGVFEKITFPFVEKLGFDLILSTHLRSLFDTAQNFQDNLGFKFWGKISSVSWHNRAP